MELMILGLWKSLAGSHTCTMEFVIRIVHLVTAEHCFQAALIEGFVMGHKGQSLNQWLNLFPNYRKYRSLFCLTTRQSMHCVHQ